MDTRNGYIHATAEGTQRTDQTSSAWINENAIDSARRDTESAAFEKLVNQIERSWKNVVRQSGATTTETKIPN
jgi:hypothetical protein